MPPVALGLFVASQIISEMARIAAQTERVSYDDMLTAYKAIAPQLEKAIAGWNLQHKIQQVRDDH